MSPMSLATALSGGPGAPRRTHAKRLFLFLLAGTLLVALVASLLPRGNAAAQNIGSVRNPNDTYYSQNGKCFVDTVAATGLDGPGAENFINAMQGMIGKVGHQANFTFNNGTVTATATVDCPSSGPSTGKIIFDNWITPALAVSGGLAIVIASALAITATYEKVTGKTIEQEGKLAQAITSLGGFLSTALLTYITSKGNWQSTLSSSITAVFTTYLVSAFGFDGLQNILKAWSQAAFGFAGNLAVGGAAAARGAIDALYLDFQQYVAQVR